MTTDRVLVVGIGNPLRSDDGLGLETAWRVEALDLRGVTVLCSSPLDLLDHLSTAWDHVVVLDATPPCGRPGRVQVMEAGERPLRPGGASASSHGVGVVEAIELARRLGQLPARVTLIGIEAASSGFGGDLSAAALDGLDEAVVTAAAAIAGAGGSRRDAPAQHERSG